MSTLFSHPRFRLLAASVAGFACLLLGGCGEQRSASRPMVCASPKQMGDLYWNGQLTDSLGNRWDVVWIPGVAPTGRIAGDSYCRAWGYIKATGSENIIADGSGHRISLVRESYHFAFADCGRDFLAKGLAKDYVGTSHQLASLCHDKPFGWFPQFIGRSIWGYVLKPGGRLVAGSIGTIGGAAVGTGAGTIEGGIRLVAATGDVAVMGTAYPIARLVWLQPSWAFSIVNAEPNEPQNGHWGLSIIARAEPHAAMTHD